MNKIVCEVAKVNNPMSIDGNSLHVSRPCPLYKVGDRMTFRIKPPAIIVLEETDNVCISAFSGMLSLLRGLMMGKKDDWDYIDTIQYIACPDAERPVIFQVKRIPE